MSEKLRLVERATWENVRIPDAPGCSTAPQWVQLTTPSAPTPWLNGVFRCELNEDEILDRVHSTIAHYKALNSPFRWKIVPSSRPKQLGNILIEHGLFLKETLFGLIADASTLRINVNPDVRIEELNINNLEDWLSVQANAWKVPPQGITHNRKKMTETLEKNDKTYENYLAYLNDKPIGSAALKMATDYAYLMGGAVNPEAHQQGVYRTLTSHRLQRIAKTGLPAVIHCLENTSAPICLKLGFEKVCEIHSYEPLPLR